MAKDFDSQWKGSDESKVATTEKVACDRCRQRKTKCDRVNPCKQCVKTGARCTYILGHRAKQKRQRVLISSVYERRLEHISNKIDELGEIVKRLGDERPVSGAEIRHQSLSQAEGIESTLFAHVIFTTGILQATVMDNSYANVATEITSALDALWTTVNVQKQQNETLEGSRPFPKELPSGLSLRDLPIPSMKKIMACLRIAQESSPSQLYWPFEFGSLGDFNQYVIKACSPGPITDMELIIVHYVLFWLFTECSNNAGDEAVRWDYEVQALTCRDSLETIISNLSFHINTNIDSICAMYMANQQKEYKGKCACSGWSTYLRSLSLRLGKLSTIRDQDITVPRLLMDRKMASLVYNRMPDWIDFASLHGRVYDNLYSPNALAQPFSVRVSRTNALASELERMISARVEFYKRPNQWTSHVIHPGLCRFIIHANRAIEYSTLASIYRGAPSGKPFSLASCPECITAARVALEENETCISMIADVPTWPPSLDLWVNEILLLAPFMPFLILLSNIVESSDSSDLERLQRLIDGLHSLTRSPRYSSCIKQLRIFKALYDVAANYVQTKARRHSADLIGDQSTDLHTDTYLNDNIWLDTEFELWKASQF